MSESFTPPFPHHGEAERWLPVVGYEGIYEVSDLGRVWSAPRGRTRGGILKPATGVGGYPFVGLYRDGHCSLRRVHHLVLEAFTGPCPPGMEARHGPGGAADARLANLSWGTHTENMEDKIRDGTMNFGERHGLAKLTDAVVDECRTRAAAGENQSALAREFSVSQSTMHNALKSKTWRQASALPVATGNGRGENHGMARLTEADVAEIRRRYAAGEMQRTIAGDYGVHRQHIGRIVNGKRWA